MSLEASDATEPVEPSTRLSIRLLGVPRVLRDDELVRFRTRHAELAAYLLALAGDGGLPTDELVQALWPGVDDERSGPRLRTMLWQLRGGLDDHAWRVRRGRTALSLDLRGVSVDLGSTPPRRADLLVGWSVDLPPVLLGRVR